jgi:hypothetical protein
MPLFFGVVDGHLFCMKASEMVVPTFGDDDTVLDQNASDHGIWTDVAPTSLGDQQGAFHERRISLAPVALHASPKSVEFKTSCMAAVTTKNPLSTNYAT